MFSLSASPVRSGQKGLIIRLAASGGEINLPRTAVQQFRHSFSCGQHRTRCLLSHCVMAARIAKAAGKIRQHRFQCLRSERGCGRMVGINYFRIILCVMLKY